MNVDEDSSSLQTRLTLTPSSDEEANATEETLITSAVEPYRSVVPVKFRKVYGIPFILMRSHHYGGLKVFLTISSIVSYFVNSVVSPTKNFFVDQILTYVVEYVLLSWILAPYFQTHDWIANTPPAGDTSNEGRT